MSFIKSWQKPEESWFRPGGHPPAIPEVDFTGLYWTSPPQSHLGRARR